MAPPVVAYGMGTLLSLAAKRWASIVDDRLAGLELSATKYAVLCAVEAAPAQVVVSQRMVADMTMYDVMLVSSVISKLVQDGLVLRDQHPSDQRTHIIRLSDKGASTLKKAHKHVSKVDRDFFAESSAPEKVRKMLSPLLTP